MLPKFCELFACQCICYNSRELKLMLGTYTFVYLFQVRPIKLTKPGACMDSSITRTEVLYDRKSDPDAKVTPKMWRTGPPIICCARLTVLYTVLIKYKYLWKIVLNVCAKLILQKFKPWSNILNILTEQHWTFVQQSWVLFSDVQLLGGQRTEHFAEQGWISR